MSTPITCNLTWNQSDKKFRASINIKTYLLTSIQPKTQITKNLKVSWEEPKFSTSQIKKTWRSRDYRAFYLKFQLDGCVP